MSAGARDENEEPTLAKCVKRKIGNCQSEVKMSRVVVPLTGCERSVVSAAASLPESASWVPKLLIEGYTMFWTGGTVSRVPKVGSGPSRVPRGRGFPCLATAAAVPPR